MHFLSATFPRFTGTSIMMLVMCTPVLAHEAHVHGLAKLDVVVEQQQLQLHLESPLANLIGFEHVPATEQERQSVRKMATQLRQTAHSFTPNAAAQCTLTEVTLHSPRLPQTLLGNNNQPTHLAQPHQHDKHAGHAHADLTANFRFTCAQPAQLRYIDVPLFATFTAMERIQVQSVSAQRQSAATLTPSNPQLLTP